MNPSAKESENWSSIKSQSPTQIKNLVFSPSGRWGIDVFRKFSGDIGILVNLLDMSTMSYKQYYSSELDRVTKVADTYWISEAEFVLIADSGKKIFTQIYCHVNHEKRCVAPFFGKHVFTPYPSPEHGPQYLGASPLYYKGQRYHVVIQGQILTLIPWNYFYHDGNKVILKLFVSHRRFGTNGESTTYELAFCYGSKIYMPIKRHIRSPGMDGCSDHEYYVQIMCTIDMNKIEFVNGFADIQENRAAVSSAFFDMLNRNDIDPPKCKVLFKQIGKYLLAYTMEMPPLSAGLSFEVRERSIFMINLAESTIGGTRVTAGPLYFPTIYRDQLFVIRNNIGRGPNSSAIWTNEFTTKPLVKSKVSSLEQLAQLAQVRYSIPADPVFEPFIFTKMHCCIPSKECFCEGILRTSHANTYSIRENINNSLINMSYM